MTAQFSKPLWGAHVTRNSQIIGRSSLALAADATRYDNPRIRGVSRLFVAADTEAEARRVLAAYDAQTRGFDRGVAVVRHATTGLPVLVLPVLVLPAEGA